MLRGEIRLTDLEPVRGSEANQRRPAVIVSNDRANASAARHGRGVITIVPVTSNVGRGGPLRRRSAQYWTRAGSSGDDRPLTRMCRTIFVQANLAR